MKSRGIISFFSKHNLILSVLIHLVLFGVFYALVTPYFRTNDDAGVLLSASGLGIVTEPTEFVLYSNVIIGYLLRLAYSISSEVPWYGLYLILALFVSHVVILYVLIRRNPSYLALGAYLVYFLLIGTNLLAGLQFTIVGSVTVIAGMILLIFGGKEGNRSNRELFAGGFLIVFGSWIRWDSYLVMMALSVPLWIWYVLEQSLKPNLRVVGIIVLAAALSFGSELLDRYSYEQHDKGWYWFNELSDILVDFRMVDRLSDSDRAKALAEVGWSTNDHYMMKSWFYMDEAIYSPQKFSTLIEYASPLKAAVDPVDSYYLLRAIVRTPFAKCFLWMYVVFGALILFNRNNILLLSGWISVLFLLFVYMIYFHQPPPPRFYIPMMVYGLLVLLNVQSDSGKKWKAILLLILAGFWSYGNLTAIKRESTQSVQANVNLRNSVQALQAFEPSKEHHYYSLGSGFPIGNILPLESQRYLSSLTLFCLADNQRTADSKKILKQYGVTDVYQDLSGDGKGYLIVNKAEDWLKDNYCIYMWEHYQRSLVPRKVLETERFTMYHFEAKKE